MCIDFKDMTCYELCNYAKSYDFQTYRDLNPADLQWVYIENFLLEDIKILQMKDRQDWVSWIDKEQSMFVEDMDYDRYAEVEEYWIPNPYEEPIIMVKYLDGIYDISDGWHRTGLAFRNNLFNVPVILGIET